MKIKYIWLILILLIVTNGLQYYSNLKLEAGTQTINQQLFPVIRASDYVITGLIRQQNGARGYSFSSDSSFLSTYEEGTELVSLNSAIIKEILKDFPELQGIYDSKLTPIKNEIQTRLNDVEYIKSNSREFWYRNRMYVDSYQKEHDKWIRLLEEEKNKVSNKNDFYRELSKYMFLLSLLVTFIFVLIFIRFYKISKVKSHTLKKLANLDALTGIGNRRLFQETIIKMRKSGTPFQLILIDIDNFKEYNDSYGHLAGDACLKKVSEVIESHTKEIGFYSRIGGEEFAVILPNFELQKTLTMAEELRKNIELLEIPHTGSPYNRITISIGLTSIPTLQKENFERYYEVADQALYESKKQGRNRINVRDIDSAV